MTKEKILKIVLIILGAAMISALGYGIWKMNKDIEKISNKPPEITIPKKAETKEIDTSDWKTYKDEKYQFEFKYPRGWFVNIVMEEDYYGGIEKWLTIGKSLDEYGHSKEGINFIIPVVSKGEESMNLSSVSQELIGRCVKRSPILISGVPGMKYEGSYYERDVGYVFISEIVVLKNGVLYDFEYKNENGVVPQEPQYTIFEKIIESIRFLDLQRG
jgi:hypothetical protein